jgi:predicted thioredoxin/glutaredoxin
MAAAEPGVRLVLYTRENCGLCDELMAELAPWLSARGLALEVRDVDADPVTRRRFGLKVPVLTVDGALACYGRLDLATVERLLDS